MPEYFYVSNFKIPIELKAEYQKISNEFEMRVYDSIRTEEDSENNKEISKEFNNQ